MKSMGMCRVDKTGRISIPHKVRREMAINTGTELEISISGESVILEKVENRCVFCRSKDNLKVVLNGYCVCDDCRDILACIVE